MPPVIPIVFAAVLGFGAGYKLKDCLCKKENPTVKPNTHIKENHNDTADVIPARLMDSMFSLHRIEKIFRQFNVPLTSDYSFSRLLDVMERDSYISLLRYVDQEISSPSELSYYLENERLNIVNFEITNSDGEPYISHDGVNAILDDQEVDYSHFKTLEEKVEFLLTLAQGKGTKRFQESFGNDLAAFFHKYNMGEDTAIVFDGIKATVHNRLEFLS